MIDSILHVKALLRESYIMWAWFVIFHNPSLLRQYKLAIA